MKVWRRVPDAEELWRLEHVGEECGMQNARLFGRKKLRQHRDVVHARDHDSRIRRGDGKCGVAPIGDREGVNRIVQNISRTHQDVERSPSRRRAGCVGCELVGRVQHRPVVTERTDPLFARRGSTVHRRRTLDRASLTACVLPAGPAAAPLERTTASPCSRRIGYSSAEIRQSRRVVLPSAEWSPARVARSPLTLDPAGQGFSCRTSAPDRALACSPYSARRGREPLKSRMDHQEGSRPAAAGVRSRSWRARKSWSCR